MSSLASAVVTGLSSPTATDASIATTINTRISATTAPAGVTLPQVSVAAVTAADNAQIAAAAAAAVAAAAAAAAAQLVTGAVS